MTEQEAIEVIKANYPTSGYEELKEALDMAILALDIRSMAKPFKEVE